MLSFERLEAGYILYLTADIITTTDDTNNEITVIDNQLALLENGINDSRGKDPCSTYFQRLNRA